MSNSPAKEQGQHQLKHELRDLISVLTGLGRNSGGSADDGTGIITLAGSNRGATMRMEGPEAAAEVAAVHRDGDGRGTEAFANSNYQSINNSIVIGGSCGTEDPGIHLHIEDYMEEEADQDGGLDHLETKGKEAEKSERGKSEDGAGKDE